MTGICVPVCVKHFQQVLNVGAETWEPEIRRKAPLSCNAALSMLQCSFSLVAVQLLVKMTSVLQRSERWAVQLLQRNFPKIAAQLLFFACGMLQGWC